MYIYMYTYIYICVCTMRKSEYLPEIRVTTRP